MGKIATPVLTVSQARVVEIATDEGVVVATVSWRPHSPSAAVNLAHQMAFAPRLHAALRELVDDETFSSHAAWSIEAKKLARARKLLEELETA